MAVPTTNMKISDITSALSITNTNVKATDLFLSPNIIGSGLDPTYCSGDDGYARLANLRDIANLGGVREFRIGKFRNYQKPTIYYKTGLHYNYRAIKAYDIGEIPSGKSWLSDTIKMPSGWRIMTMIDWANILPVLNASWTIASNLAGGYLKHGYDETDSYYGWVILQGLGYINFNQLATGNFTLTTTGNPFVPYRFVYAGLNETSLMWSLYDGRSSQPYFLRLNDTNQQANFLSSGTFTFEKNIFANVRLIQANYTGGYNSVDPKYVEDCDGNIYPTIKIGNYVMTAECIRTKTTYDGLDLTDYTRNVNDYFDVYPNALYEAGYIDYTDNDIA